MQTYTYTNNGRVRDSGRSGHDVPVAFDYQSDTSTSLGGASRMATGTMEHIHTTTPVSRLFFSPLNVEALQEGIRYRVYVESGDRFVIDRQSGTELAVVMRSLYLQHGDNRTGDRDDVIRQVRDLNAWVLNFCVPRIVQEIEISRYYRHDIANLPEPLPLGQLATSKGTRTLVLNRF
jgi:hypothetical protein